MSKMKKAGQNSRPKTTCSEKFKSRITFEHMPKGIIKKDGVNLNQPVTERPERPQAEKVEQVVCVLRPLNVLSMKDVEELQEALRNIPNKEKFFFIICPTMEVMSKKEALDYFEYVVAQLKEI